MSRIRHCSNYYMHNKKRTYKRKRSAVALLALIIMLMLPASVFAETGSSAEEIVFDTEEVGYYSVQEITRTVTSVPQGSIEISSMEWFTASASLNEEGSLLVSMSPRKGLPEGNYEEELVIRSGRREVFRAQMSFEVTEIKWPKMIKNLDIRVQDVEAGYVCSGSFTVQLYGYDSSQDGEVRWMCIEDSRTLRNGKDLFEAGKTYQASVDISADDGHYYFKDAFEATINGKYADISMEPGARRCTLTCQFGPLVKKNIAVYDVSLRFRIPKAGDSDLPEVHYQQGRGYCIAAVEEPVSFYKESGGELVRVDSGTRFLRGVRYVMRADVQLVDDQYEWYEDLKAHVNGEDASISLSEDGLVRVEYQFYAETEETTEHENTRRKDFSILVIAAVVIMIGVVFALLYIGRD